VGFVALVVGSSDNESRYCYLTASLCGTTGLIATNNRERNVAFFSLYKLQNGERKSDLGLFMESTILRRGESKRRY